MKSHTRPLPCGWRLALTASLLAAAAGITLASPAPADQAGQMLRAQQALQGLSMPFEANGGQFDPAVAFVGRTFAGPVHITHRGQIVYSLAGPAQAPRSKAARTSPAMLTAPAGWSLTETLVGALPLAPEGGDVAASRVTHLIGQASYQPATYRNLHLGQAWPGVQVELAARGANMEKLFHVAPHADTAQIRVQLDGALSLRLGEGGTLVATTGHGDVAYTAPVAFQEVAGRRVDVPVRYALDSQGHAYGFALGDYDRSLPLVIDPLLQSTYLGGSGHTVVETMAIDPSSGDILVAGFTLATDFPGTAGGAQSTNPGVNGFVARLSGHLALQQSTYLGTSSYSPVNALAISATGEVAVAGQAYSRDIPGTAGGARPASTSNPSGFVMLLSNDLRHLVRSTYLGSGGWEVVTALAFAPSDEIVVAGYTISPDLLQIAGGAQASFSGTVDGFITRLSGDLRTPLQSTYLGGAESDYVTALAILPSGEILAGGQTYSANLPQTTGAARPQHSGDADGFVARLSDDLRSLVRTTYLGGNQWENVTALALAPSGELVVAGQTFSRDFPGTAGAAQSANRGEHEGFIARLSLDLRTLEQSTYLGGAQNDYIGALSIDSAGEIVVAGFTQSANLLDTVGGAQAASGGDQDGFVARLAGDLRSTVQATYLGGAGPDDVTALVLAPSGEVVVAGYTGSTNFPAASGPVPPAPTGTLHGFAARLTPDLRAASPQTISFLPQADQVLATVGDTFAISPAATASSGLPVSYVSHTPTICTVAGSTVTMLDAGTCQLEAQQPGVPGQWLAASGVFVDVRIQRPQTIAFPAQPDQPFTAGGSFPLVAPATASSGLPVQYASTTPGLCTVSGSTVTMVGAGLCTLVASQPGNALWLAAADVPQNILLVVTTPPGPGPGPGTGPGPVAPVPVLSAWPLALLGLLAGALGVTSLRRRPPR